MGTVRGVPAYKGAARVAAVAAAGAPPCTRLLPRLQSALPHMRTRSLRAPAARDRACPCFDAHAGLCVSCAGARGCRGLGSLCCCRLCLCCCHALPPSAALPTPPRHSPHAPARRTRRQPACPRTRTPAYTAGARAAAAAGGARARCVAAQPLTQRPHGPAAAAVEGRGAPVCAAAAPAQVRGARACCCACVLPCLRVCCMWAEGALVGHGGLRVRSVLSASAHLHGPIRASTRHTQIHTHARARSAPLHLRVAALVEGPAGSGRTTAARAAAAALGLNFVAWSCAEIRVGCPLG